MVGEHFLPLVWVLQCMRRDEREKKQARHVLAGEARQAFSYGGGIRRIHWSEDAAKRLHVVDELALVWYPSAAA